MHNPIEVHRHQSRHAQSLQRLSHSSCSNLKLQSPPILIRKCTCMCLFSRYHLREHCGPAGNKPQVAVGFLRCATVRQRRHTDNTCNTSEVNDLTPQHTDRWYSNDVCSNCKTLNVSWLQEFWAAYQQEYAHNLNLWWCFQIITFPAPSRLYMVQSQKSS